MKRAFVAAAAFLFASTAFAAAGTERYLVATKRPFRAGAVSALKADLKYDIERRSIAGFESFTGFAADLTEGEAAELRASSAVRWVERVHEVHALEVVNATGQTVPYGITNIGARAARSGRPGGGVVNVVVIDTGVDYTHPDLKDAWAGGWNVLNGTNDPKDDNGHGTHVAGTIAAADNDIGVVGVAPAVRLWSVKVLGATGSGSEEGVLKAIDWVAEQKAKLGGNWVINLSLGSSEESAGSREAFQRVADKGVFIVAAAGNSSTATMAAPLSFPAAYPSVVSVGAVTSKKTRAAFSSQGPELDFSAPGVGTLSSLPVGSAMISYVALRGEAFVNTPIAGSKVGSVTADYVFCGLGNPEEIPPSVAGKIALIKRGVLKFAEKARNAKAAGAIAVAIFNNEPESGTTWTLINESTDAAFDWPVTVRVTESAGQLLASRESVPITVAFTSFDYGEKSGTSMASPHVAGAVALLWTFAPDASPAQIINALSATALDLGPAGPDPDFGAGLIDVYGAARTLAPSAFGGITTGRGVGRRGPG